MSTREQRAAEREQRRAQSSEHDGVDAGDALKTAASAALAGAAVGAAHAFKQRRAARHAEDEHEPQAEEQQEQEQQEQPEPEAQSEPEAKPEPEPQQEEPPAPPRPMRGGEAQRIVERAREEMRALRGEDAESVSSIRRTDNGWRVSLELVELRRVPDSTDVLGTYDVELDDDGNLMTFERTGRYYRSEADHRER